MKPSKFDAVGDALASLCAEGYFDLVLTTNFDPLMDDALAAARLWRKDYLLQVNTVIRNDWLAHLLPERQPRVKVIKLHGGNDGMKTAGTGSEPVCEKRLMGVCASVCNARARVFRPKGRVPLLPEERPHCGDVLARIRGSLLVDLRQRPQPGRGEGEHFETPEASRRAGGSAMVLRAGEQ